MKSCKERQITFFNAVFYKFILNQRFFCNLNYGETGLLVYGDGVNSELVGIVVSCGMEYSRGVSGEAAV